MPRGKSQRSVALVDTAIDTLTKIQPATVRAVCYQLFTRGLIDSMAKTCTNRVSTQLVPARSCYRGAVSGMVGSARWERRGCVPDAGSLLRCRGTAVRRRSQELPAPTPAERLSQLGRALLLRRGLGRWRAGCAGSQPGRRSALAGPVKARLRVRARGSGWARTMGRSGSRTEDRQSRS
jgi:hypothetical protein